MLLAVVIYASLPLAATFGLKSMNGMELILSTTIVASFAISIISLIYFARKNKLEKLIDNHKKLSKQTWLFVIGSGITHIACNGLFFLALSMSHKAGVSLIYESWPIIAVIMTPLILKKQWKQVGLNEFIVSLIALIGVAIVILSDEQINFSAFLKKDYSEEHNYLNLFGYVIAFIGGYACALNAITKGRVAEDFRNLNHDKGAIILSEFYSRSSALLMLIITFPLYANFVDISSINWLASFYIGFIVLIMGGAFYTYSIINTNQPTIHILNYLVPLLAVIALWLAGESTLTTGLFIGGGIIIACNLYLYFAGRKAEFSEAL